MYLESVRSLTSDSHFTLAWPGLGSDVLLLQIGNGAPKLSSPSHTVGDGSGWNPPHGHWFSSDLRVCEHAFQKLRSLKGKLILGKKEMASSA